VTDVDQGLRSRKKAGTRAALSRAALDLALRQGYDAVTVDAIAAAADVSTRTFRNYFSSKEDAILSLLAEVEQRQADSFLERPASEPVLDSLEAAAVTMMESGADFGLAGAVTRLIIEHPALMAHAAAVTHGVSERVVAEIGRRTGLEPDTHLEPRLIYNASRAVTLTVIELLISGKELATSPSEILQQGFSRLRCGLAVDAPTERRR
jgi:AcrR family transcriptional regulator